MIAFNYTIFFNLILFLLTGWGFWRLVQLELHASNRKISFQAPDWKLSFLDTALVLWLGFSLYLIMQYGLKNFLLPRLEGNLFLKEWKHCLEALTLHVSVGMSAFASLFLGSRALVRKFQNPFWQGFEAYAMGLPLIWLVSLGWSELIKILERFHFPLNTEPQKLVGIIDQVEDPWMMALFGFLAIITAPLAEELFFRGMLYPIFKKQFSPRLANLITALIFAFIHGNFLSFLPLFLISLLLVNAYERTGSLKTPFLFHALFNAQNFLVIWMNQFKT